MNKFDSKVVVITGGGTGIGRASTELFANEGARVLIAGRRQKPLEELSDLYPKNVSFIQSDVTDAKDRAKIVQTAIEHYGRIDALVNCAALAPLSSFEETTDEEFEKTYLTNLIAPASLIRLAMPHLSETNGAVVNVSTTMGRAKFPGAMPYSCSKAALNHLTQVLAVELGPSGIRVNAVAPGATQTEMAEEVIEQWGAETLVSMTPLGRLGDPTEIAKAVCFLASSDAQWVTGQILDASGGFML
ncbi:MAG: SDR family NAD(P)-dependent oxidoreductase [Gammaproteobacteria bacterium]